MTTRVLVTGASSGLGSAIAGALAAKGLTVFGTSRHPDDRRERSFPMLTLDVQSDDSVEACVSELRSRAGGVDVLINNAGYALTGAAEETSISEAKAQFETNFFGTVRVTDAVLPMMREAHGGKIIMISSLAGLVGIPFGAFYSATKFALEGYAESLSFEVKPFGISVSLVEPTWARTALADSGRNASRPLPDYAALEARAADSIRRFVGEGLAPERVAQTVLAILDDPAPRLRYPVGRDSVWLPRLKALVPWRTFASGVRRRFNV